MSTSTSNPEPHCLSPSLHLSYALPGPCSFQQHRIITAFPLSLLISPSTLSPFCYSVSLLLPLPGPGPNSPVARRQAGSEQERQQQRQRQLPHVSASLETRDGGMVEEFSGGEKPFRHVCSAKRKRQTPTPHWYTDIQTNNNDKIAEIHKVLTHTCTTCRARHGKFRVENLLIATQTFMVLKIVCLSVSGSYPLQDECWMFWHTSRE